MDTQEYFNEVAKRCISETDINADAMLAAIREAVVSEDSDFLNLVASAAISYFDLAAEGQLSG